MKTIKNMLNFNKILKLPETKVYEEECLSKYETQDIKFIWGAKSYDDMHDSDACLYTMNDIELIYLKNENKYSLGIETIYMFDDIHGKYKYIKNLLDKFTEFMEQNNYSTTKEFGLYRVFTKGIDINTNFYSIEECYAAFKMFVNGFCSLEKEEEK